MEPTQPEEPTVPEPPDVRWPRQQVYFVTVEWLDDVHQPESPERLAQVVRHALQHAHDHGPQMPPSRFTVRVKAGDLAAEASGLVSHQHWEPARPPDAV